MTLQTQDLFQNIKTLLHNARHQVVRAVNTTMVQTYFEIGRLIVEHEQSGNEKALYGQETLKQLSVNLSQEFGKGFSVTYLQQMCISRIEERQFYEIESAEQTTFETR